MGIFGKLVFWVNILVALLLVVSFVLPYLPPSSFPTLSLLSLAVSPLILVNGLFAIYWLIRMKRRMFLSIAVLVIAYFHFNPFIEISSEGDPSEYTNTLSVLTYNVRLFNAYEEKPSKNIGPTILELIKTQNPDVVCIQEYYREHEADFSSFPFQYIYFEGENKLGHAIFSKYPLENQGAFNFKDSNNNTIYADVKIGNETIRLYNMHLQSMGILPTVHFLQDENRDRVLNRISKAFAKQEDQVSQIIDHKAKSPYPVVLCGDLNNTSFSYVYRKLKHGMSDAFLDKGNGLGATFSFDSYPMRIDYIFATPDLEIVKFETVKNSFSDHYPVSTTLGW